MPVRLRADLTPDCIDAAARIWARATAARDGDSDPAPLELARHTIAHALDQAPGAVLLTAWDVDETPLGFAAVTLSTANHAEVQYLGVDPSAWSQGVGSRLLTELAQVLRLRGSARAELWVYADNPAAVALYERRGWRQDGQTRTHPRSKRTELRYALQLMSPGAV